MRSQCMCVAISAARWAVQTAVRSPSGRFALPLASKPCRCGLGPAPDTMQIGRRPKL